MSEHFRAGTEILALKRRAWRWRRCPACHFVERASDFETLDLGPAWEHGGFRRRCPNCSYTGPTWRFQVVRERHP